MLLPSGALHVGRCTVLLIMFGGFCYGNDGAPYGQGCVRGYGNPPSQTPILCDF